MQINKNKNTLILFLGLFIFFSPSIQAKSIDTQWYISPLQGRLLPTMNSRWSQATLTSNVNAESTLNFGIEAGVDRKNDSANASYRTASWNNAKFNSVFVNYERSYKLKQFFNFEKLTYLNDVQFRTGLGLGFVSFTENLTNSNDSGPGLNLYMGLNKPINKQWQLFGRMAYQYLGLETKNINTLGNSHTVSFDSAILFELGMRYYFEPPNRNKVIAPVYGRCLRWTR